MSLADVSISRESIKHEHVTHCFDYLRQASMCSSDDTVERVDFERGGAIAWGTAHECKRFEELIEFANKWEVHQK